MVVAGFLAGCGDDSGTPVDAAQGASPDTAQAAGPDTAQTAGPDTGIAVDAQVTLGVDAGIAIDSTAAGVVDVASAIDSASAVDSAGAVDSTGVGPVAVYDVVATFREPMTQPNDTIFTGTFAFNLTSKTVSDLKGTLTQSMTKVNGAYGGPMTTVALTNQLSSVPAVLDGASGLLVTTFALTTTDTFTGGGFAPGGTQYYGLLEGTPNNNNAYATIFVSSSDPTAAPTPAQIDKLAYADCTAGGMMMSSCMTGTSVSGYGVKGTMGGYPLSLVITRR
jgi:hypothetical protein